MIELLHALKNSSFSQTRKQLGTPGGAKNFREGPKVFELCPIILNNVEHIFPGRQKILYGGLRPHW